MKQVAVLLAPGFEEIEAVTIVDILRRADLRTLALGVQDLEIEGAHGIRMRADAKLSEKLNDVWDAVILPGGMPGASNLRDSDDVQALLKKQNAEGRRIGAICAAPIALAKAGLLEGRKATCYPGYQEQLRGAELRNEDVVVDRNIVTSRGPATAIPFALELVAELKDRQAAEKIRGQLLAK